MIKNAAGCECKPFDVEIGGPVVFACKTCGAVSKDYREIERKLKACRDALERYYIDSNDGYMAEAAIVLITSLEGIFETEF